MTVLAIDGFDMYNGTGVGTGLQSRWVNAPANTSFSMVTGRFGGQALQTLSGGNYVNMRLTLSASYVNFGVGVAIQCTALPTDTAVGYHFMLLKGGTVTLGVRVTNAGALAVYRATSASAGTLLGTSASGIVHLNQWHYLEIGTVIDDTVGSVSLTLDGGNVLTLTGQDTNNAVGSVDTVALGPSRDNVSSGLTGNFQWDDFYCVDSATTLGERRVETLRPASDSSKVWTPDTGTANFSRVNETLVDGDTSYVSSSNVGDRDLYTVSSLSSSPSTVDAVNVVSFARKTDAATRAVYNSVQSQGTNSDGSQLNVNATYGRFDRLIANDPHGGSWTAAHVNGLLIGPKVAA